MKRVLAIILIVCLSSCSTSYCLKVEGGSNKYGIDNAAVEYCHNPTASDSEKAIVFNSSDGEKHLMVRKSLIDRANAIIEGKNKVGASVVDPTKKQEPPMTAMEKFINLTK